MSKTDIKSNNLTQTFWILTIVMVVLLLLSFLPEIRMGFFHFKKIDVLSDLHHDLPANFSVADSVTAIHGKAAISQSSKLTVSPIEDFSGDEQILTHFNKALDQVNREPVRIAFFGDSFIEGDIITASLRDTLQKVFGGNGVGLVPLASETSGFRKSIKHTYSGWNTHSLITLTNPAIPIGISGYTYIPEKENIATYMPGKVPPQQKFKKIKLLYQSKGVTSLSYTINNETVAIHRLDSTNSIRQYTIDHQGIHSIQFHITPSENVYLYGVSFEDDQGLYIDNFAMRRNSGIALSRLSPALLKQFNNYLNYKLIILQYGLNVASEADSTNYGWYSGKMITIIKNLKEVFPHTSFLLISVSDRGVNKQGEVVTMDAITKLRDVQREIARKSGIAFWDLFEAMGGKNSIAQYTAAVPPMASKDYTHLTHLGGIKIGKKLADVLLQEMNNHEE